jgi:hypothetical protein
MLGMLGRQGLKAALAGRFRRFEADLTSPVYAQARVLTEIVAGMARTEYGRSLGIRDSETYGEFARRVPVVEYEELRPWIDRQAASREPVLAPEPVVVYEQTSGSVGPAKLIPYTPSLLRSFDAMVRLWIYDLLRRGPSLDTGRTFVSVSQPVRDARTTRSGVPIGLADDTRYLSPSLRRALRGRFLVPSDLGSLRSWAGYRRALATWLVSESALEVISVWSPTYLTTLLDWISDNRTEITESLSTGIVTANGVQVPVRVRADAGSVLGSGPGVDWLRVWPRLKLLSCWADGASTRFLPRLRNEFPGLWIQPKGLLATEAPLTLPLCHAAAPVPLLGEVFLEFESNAGGIHLLNELEIGREYSLIVTQRGGLLRYRMGDVVRCERRMRATPTLRFLGRTREVADLVGEKLNERFVRESLDRLPAISRAFSFLVPVARSTEAPHYLCVTDGLAETACDRGGESGGGRRTLVREQERLLDRELQRAVQYGAARGLGQLGGVEILPCRDAKERFTRLYLGRGMRWGDIKCSALVDSVSETEFEALIS